MTLETVRGGAPQVPCVEVLSLAPVLDGDDGVALGGDVPPAQPVGGVDVSVGVSPGAEGVGGHPQLGATAGLTEAAGVAVEKVIPASPLKQDGRLVIDGRYPPTAGLGPVGVVVVWCESLHHHGVVVAPGIVGDVGRPVLVVGVHHHAEVSPA